MPCISGVLTDFMSSGHTLHCFLHSWSPLQMHSSLWAIIFVPVLLVAFNYEEIIWNQKNYDSNVQQCVLTLSFHRKILYELPICELLPTALLLLTCSIHDHTILLIGSCKTIVWKDVEKFQKFPPCRLQDISIWSKKNPFFVTAKIWAVALHKVKSLWKNFQNNCNPIIHSSRQVV